MPAVEVGWERRGEEMEMSWCFTFWLSDFVVVRLNGQMHVRVNAMALGVGVYLIVEQVCRVPESRHRLSLGTAVVVPLGLSYLAQLLVQGFLLELQLLSVACLQPQFPLQGTHHPVLGLQLVHL